MKRQSWLFAFIIAFACQGVVHGQPGAGGAQLKLPGMDPLGPSELPKTGPGDPIKNLWSPASGAFPSPAKPGGVKVEFLPGYEDADKEIEALFYAEPLEPPTRRKRSAVVDRRK